MKKRHVAPHFNCYDVRNEMVPLTMLMASCDAKVSANGMNDQKSHVALYFHPLDVRNAIVPLTVPSASHAAYVNSNGGR